MIASRTYQPRPEKTAETWYLFNAEGQTLGRFASRVAQVLRGKTTATFAPWASPNIHVVIINAEKIELTGDKKKTKVYRWHTIYRTGLKAESVEHLLQRKPTEVVRRAVQGMIPKGPLGRRLMRYVRVYAGAEHPHAAQNPKVVTIGSITRAPKAKSAAAAK